MSICRLLLGPREMRLRTRLGPSHWPLLQRLPTSLAMVLDPGLVLFAALPPLQLRWTAPLPGLRLMRRKSDQLGGVMRWQQFSRRNSPPQPAAASTATKPRRGPVQALLSRFNSRLAGALCSCFSLSNLALFYPLLNFLYNTIS
jgi:hypothetical protein